MGDGKKLKDILDEKKKSVRWLAKVTTISPTTLYSIIQKDTSNFLQDLIKFLMEIELKHISRTLFIH